MEVGSIFDIEVKTLFDFDLEKDITLPLLSGEYSYSLFNSGRAAIEALFLYLKNNGRVSRVWVPSFVCSSVYEAIRRAGVEVAFYAVGDDLGKQHNALSDIRFAAGDCVYIIQYFDLVLNSEIATLVDSCRRRGVVVVEDVTLSIMRALSETFGFGDYIIGSIRKWLPVPDGGFIASRFSLPSMGKSAASNDYSQNYLIAQMMKSEFLKDSSLDKNKYLYLVKESMAALFSDYEIRDVSLLTKGMLGTFDCKKIVERRLSNQRLLSKLLDDLPQVRLLSENGPAEAALGLFLRVEHRDELFSYLVKSEVYCNIHWRENEAALGDKGALSLSRSCITVPTDQRYGEEDMSRISEVMHAFYEGE